MEDPISYKIVNVQDALDMLKLSDRFGFDLLKDALGDKLIVEINIENILHLLTYADLHQVTSLLNELSAVYLLINMHKKCCVAMAF